jgi:hypothetical protein
MNEVQPMGNDGAAIDPSQLGFMPNPMKMPEEPNDFQRELLNAAFLFGCVCERRIVAGAGNRIELTENEDLATRLLFKAFNNAPEFLPVTLCALIDDLIRLSVEEDRKEEGQADGNG